MKHEETVREEIEMPTYTSAELDELGEWLDQFRRNTENHSIDIQEAMVGFGAMSKKIQKISRTRCSCLFGYHKNERGKKRWKELRAPDEDGIV